MPYRKDPLWLSTIWGRVGSFVLSVLGVILMLFGVPFTDADMGELDKNIGALMAGAGGLLAFISKYREKRKAEED